MMSRLKTWRLKDGNGTEGDSLTLVLNSTDIEGLPPKGERYTVWLDDVKRDVFQISRRSATLNPRDVTLVLTVAPFTITDSTGFRERKSASWDNVPLGQIVKDCVTPHGFSVYTHPRLAKIMIEHCDRTEQSTPAFLNVLAKQFDAVAKPVNDKYVFVPTGEASSVSGKPIETLTLSQPALNQRGLPNFINVSTNLDGRTDFNGVKAFYHTTQDGERKEVQQGTEPFMMLGKDKNSEQEGKQAAAAALRRIKRQGRQFEIEAPPVASVFAEGIVILDASFPSAFQGKCSIDQVTFSGQGLQPTKMNITATLTGDA